MKRLLLILLMASGVVAAQTDDIPVVSTDSTITQDTTSTTTTTLKSPPPSAVIPTMNNTNSDLCTVGVAGAVQTQILGISAGGSVRDMNCEKLKNAKVLYDMGMKVAAVSVMCQDKRVFDAMMMAGTPCPYDGMIGLDAKAAWTANEEVQPVEEETQGSLDEVTKKTLVGLSGVASLLIMLVVL
tara:strand:- start:4969 stop:5520 length:552 start_codon:yes stop_codon:yes gene_type:complete